MSNFKLTLELLSYSEVRPEKILKERHDDIIDQFVNYYKKESNNEEGPIVDIIRNMLTDKYSSVDEVISAINNLNV